jgi:hypothetical protein
MIISLWNLLQYHSIVRWAIQAQWTEPLVTLISRSGEGGKFVLVGKSFPSTFAHPLNPNASQDEIVKSGQEVIASLYGGIIYEGLNFLWYRKFTRKVSASPCLAPTSVF